MRPAAPPVFPVFRSQLQADLLVRLFVGDVEESISDLATEIDANPGNTLREVERLERGGIVNTRRVGRTRLVKANVDAPFYRPLHGLVLVTMGPAHVLAKALADIDGIESASIFGSWAARITGEDGPAPHDIDLLVIGAPDRDDLYDRTTEAAHTLGREVNTVVISPQRWARASEGFIKELSTRPRVAVLPARNRAQEGT
ncbi:ArsR family transcriptional regulator [Jiangella muralis]|uniref:ArsR family transcriptional regulator n=1 Tax=Jiangella muralis TaxID=702383 RepID=UPI0012FA9E9D|nr:ArsR family transcriptional regulator [Jiangella muralis]